MATLKNTLIDATGSYTGSYEWSETEQNWVTGSI